MSVRGQPRLLLLVWACVLSTISALSNAYAWDNKREGITLAIGSTGGYMLHLARDYDTDTNSMTDTGIASVEVKAGYGFNERFILNLVVGRGDWGFPKTSCYEFFGPGVTWFFGPKTPAVFVEGNIGAAYRNARDGLDEFHNGDFDSGMGIDVGIGIEILPHMTFGVGARCGSYVYRPGSAFVNYNRHCIRVWDISFQCGVSFIGY